MNIDKATRIEPFNFGSQAMRSFHITWLSFFVCFFGWFGVAPLMAVIRDELSLTRAQVGNTIIASVMITIVGRLVAGWFCDLFGPRKTYTGLLIFGALPVLMIGMARTYESFLFFRLMIGVVGASFVVTQFHTSLLFAPNCVGTANATSAGWGNLGGGVAQVVMPLLMGVFLALGVSQFWAWRLTMIVPGVLMIAMGVLYYFCSQDTMEGNFEQLREGARLSSGHAVTRAYREVCVDKRVWALFGIYAACFGMELTIHNIAALYFRDQFDAGLKVAGLSAGLFGLMNIFTRTLGGFFGDRFGVRYGLKGRVGFLGGVLFFEGLMLILFSRMTGLASAIGMLLLFGLFVQMASGATFSTVPFIHKKALGAVSGIVGAGGSAGAVLAGFLFRMENVSWPDAMFVLGILVALSSGLTFFVRFSEQAEIEARHELLLRLEGHAAA